LTHNFRAGGRELSEGAQAILAFVKIFYLITRSARAGTLGGIIFVSSNRSIACAPFKSLSEVAAVSPVRKTTVG